MPDDQENLGFDVPQTETPSTPPTETPTGESVGAAIPSDFAGILQAQREAQDLPEDTPERAQQKQELLSRLAQASLDAQQISQPSLPEDPAEARKVADIQTEHARAIQLADLARTYPVVQSLIDELAALKNPSGGNPA